MDMTSRTPKRDRQQIDIAAQVIVVMANRMYETAMDESKDAKTGLRLARRAYKNTLDAVYLWREKLGWEDQC